jgi:membrane fusion protein
MHNTSPLFRPEAVLAQRTDAFGPTILLQPISHLLLTGAAALIGSTLIAVLVWGTYTRHSTLAGQLLPNLGVIKVRTPQFGTIVEKHKLEGDRVQAGDVLYVISSERVSSLGATQDLVARELGAQEQSLREQVEKVHQLEHADRASLEQMIATLNVENANLGAMIDTQRERVALAEQSAERYEQMRGKGFVSEEQLIAKKGDLLDQRSRLDALEREQSTASRQLTDLQNQAASSPLKYQNQAAELERGAASIRRDLGENEARRLVAITAPASGIATAVTGEVGQIVDSSRALMSIVPVGSFLQAHLYAPSHAVGFINVGDHVLMRYRAYPYQKFGHHEGTVESVSKVALSAGELAGMDAGSQGGAQEPVYEVTIKLASQSIAAYGERRPLQAGMALDADVLQDTRRLYEWMLEPLYTITGKMHN